jgi:hypothetical protein
MKRFLVFLLLVLLSACPDTTIKPPGPTPTGAVSSTVSPAGQTIKVVSDLRVEATLEFPANAVSQDVTVTVTPVASSDGAWLTLELLPEGISLNTPVKLTVILPEGQVLDADGLVYYGSKADPKPVLTTLNSSSRTLSAELTYFGTPSITANAAQTRDTPPNNNINAGSVTPDSRITAADNALTSFANAASTSTLTPTLEAARVLQALGTPRANTWLNAAKIRACTGYDAVALVASSTVITLPDQLKSVVGGLLYWNKLIQQLGASCGSDYLDQAQAKFDQFIVFFEEEVNKTSFDAEKLEQALNNTLSLLREAQQLGFTDVQGKLLTLGANLVPKWRNAAYSACQAGRPSGRRSLYKIINNRLESLYPALDVVAVTKDLNFCDFNVKAKLISPTNRTLETKNLGGLTPGIASESWSARSPVTGKLHLEADFLPTYCPNSNTSPIELTLYRADTSKVKVWQSTSTLSIFEDIDLVSLLGGAEPTTLETQSFTLMRSEACNSLYKTSALSLTFSFNPKPKLEAATATPNALLASATFAPQNFSLQFSSNATIVKVHDVAKLLPGGGSLTDDHAAGQFVVDAVNNKITLGTSVRVQCSEKGKPTLQNTFQLIDDLDQTSSEKSTNISIDYKNC